MAMIKCETDSDKLKCCLETMSFMALDEANRMVGVLLNEDEPHTQPVNLHTAFGFGPYPMFIS